MLARARSPSLWYCAQFCLLVDLLCACGRVGVNLLPLEAGRAASGGAGDSALDAGGGTGGAALDAGGSAGTSAADAGGSGAAGSGDAGGAGQTYVGCPTSCENPHGAADCSTGSCISSCANGYQDCDGDATNGCEASIQDTTAQCGGCALACQNDHGTSACQQGLCVASCASGFGDCDDTANNGCETALSSVSDCGGCGQLCANSHGSASCTTGTCLLGCDAGYADCDGNAANGCETPTGTDPQHCGSCAGACPFSTQICSGGSCMVSSCAVGKGECDGDASIACETDLTSSLSNCGFCGNVCSAANGTPSCSSSACAIAACNGGYDDCDGLASTGCEVTLASNVANCGGCGNACTNPNGSTSCVGGACAPLCASGYGDCDGNLRNGCELPLNSVSNCGMCGKTCPANGGTPGCAAGVCTTTCNLTGRYALKLSVPASWPSTSLLSSGSGTFTYWGELQLTQSANNLSGTLWWCGHVVPDFAAAPIIGENYGITFPGTLYDATPLPSTVTSGTLGSSSPGASFALARSALVQGLTMADPVNGAWPSAASVVSADSDADGKPGITGPYKSGGSYSSPPVNNFGTARAIRDYVASRLVFTLSGTLTSCTQSSGSVAPQGIDVHTLGCRISGDSRDCSGSETSHLDTNAPGYSTSAGTYSLIKVSDTATCSAVRAALP
jgi:hypothetical protein